MFFRSGSHFENLMGSLLRSLLKYNAKSLLMESSSIPSGVQACRRGMIYDSFVCDLFCDLHVYSFSCDFFCKFKEILMKKFVKYVYCPQYYLAKIS